MTLALEKCRGISITLKILQLLLGCISIIGLVVDYSSWTHNIEGIIRVYVMDCNPRVLAFIVCTSTFLTSSFLLLIATVHRYSYEHMRKSIFELLHNISGAIVHAIPSVVLITVSRSLEPWSFNSGFFAAGVLAAFYLGTVSHYTTETIHGEAFVYGHMKVMSFITITAGFMIPTFLLLVVHLHTQSAEKQKKSIFEFLYNICAVVFLVSASITLLSFSERLPNDFRGRNAWRAGGIMGLMNTVLYGASAVLAFIDYHVTD